ncbi:hypothetical protein B9Z55_007689 [Caenorhabditis nigoni]|uniref:BTB domain-containing protein n=1 Tax=Caenorhabditis nigoni TaxID=1611254 RepID=A0A2G5VBF0_9PELO|nr:hypothetical protein B9Z55_007689 [Caenorhabditis nigoni]
MATNEEDNMRTRTEPDLVLEFQKMRSELIEEMKKNQAEVLHKLYKTEDKIEDIKKDNKKNLDEISNRLKSIEALSSKISLSDEHPKKSEKTFKLNHVFSNVKDFQEDVRNFSEWENHFNANWRISMVRHSNHLGFYIFCEPIAPSDKWSIRTKNNEYKVCGKNQDIVFRSSENFYQEKLGYGFPRFQEWEDIKEWFLANGNLTVEAKITIIETVGLEKKRLRKFDESQKDISDVILVFLASQSDVFKALLFGNFKESKQSEVKLNGIDPDDFHYFLEVLYGESAIDDTTVEGVALLADMYDVPNAIRKCEEFLLEKSKKTLEKKLELATCYHLRKLEEKCTIEITAIENVQSGGSKDDDHQTKFDFIKVLIDFLFICLFVIVVAIGLSIILIVL